MRAFRIIKANVTHVILRWSIPAPWCLGQRAFSITIGKGKHGSSTGF